MSEIIDVRVFMGRLILTVDDEYHEVELFNSNKKLKKGFGYINGSLVYIFRGKLEKQKSDLKPGIYIDNNREYIFVEPDLENRNKYTLDNIIELNLDKIFEQIEEHEDDFMQAKDIEVINNNAEVYVPTIKEEDDFLKYIVKKAIRDKKTNLKNYKDKFPSNYALNNMKSTLNKGTKMTVPNFLRWCEVLGLNWRIEVCDAGTDKPNPLPDPIIINSDDF